MKQIYLLISLCLSINTIQATTRYWVGASNGNFNSATNWSSTSGGLGGAGVPGSGDDAVFEANALVHLNLATITLNSVLVRNNSTVRLYTSIGSTITVSSASTTTDVAAPGFVSPGLLITPGSVLKDSTSTNVPFDFIFNTATNARGYIDGQWIFEGGVALSGGGGPGARFTANSGSNVTVNGTVTFKNNTNNISASSSSLAFSDGSTYAHEKNAGSIPDATYSVASTVLLTGSVASLPALTSLVFGNFTINLPNLSVSPNLSFRNLTTIQGNLQIVNTNNQKLTLISNAIIPGVTNIAVTVNKNLVISGSTTNVAISVATILTSTFSYVLQVNQDFIQSGGIFSLQDYDATQGSTVLGIRGNLTQTAGTFGVNSAAISPTTLFMVEMNGSVAQDINMSGGTINNANNMVSLKMGNTSPTGVTLSTPLQVGRIEFSSGLLYTSATNMLTVNDPDTATGVKSPSSISYVNGPLRRATNSANSYAFPTGKGGVFDSCVVIPVTSTPSVYEAEYFNSGYPDQTVIVPLAGVSSVEYWNVSKLSGSNAMVKLILNAPVPGAANTDGLVVARYNGSDWISERGSLLTPGNTATGSVISRELVTFSPFTFGYGPYLALPVHLISFDAKKIQGGARLEWKVAEIPSRFEILRSNDGRNYNSLGVVNAVPGQQTYDFVDGNVQTGINYYRVRSIERDGNSTLTRVVAITNKENGVEITTMAPTIVIDKAKLFISTEKGGHMELMVTDMVGRTWRKFGISVSPGNSENTLNLSDLASGLYQVTGFMNGERTSTIRFMKK